MKIEEVKKNMLEIAEILNKFPENLQEKAFDVMVYQLWNIDTIELPSIDGAEEETISEIAPKDSEKESSVEKKIRKKNSSKEIYQINKDLNLSPKDKAFLKQLVEFKKPQSNIEFNAVVIYYMQKILNIESISIDDVYSCYKDIGRKVPNALKQSLTDTCSSKYGYIAVNNNSYSISVKGENFVELDLPKEKWEKINGISYWGLL